MLFLIKWLRKGRGEAFLLKKKNIPRTIPNQNIGQASSMFID